MAGDIRRSGFDSRHRCQNSAILVERRRYATCWPRGAFQRLAKQALIGFDSRFRCQNYSRDAVMDALIEFILLTVYCLTVSTLLVLMSRPVRWVLRWVVGAFR